MNGKIWIFIEKLSGKLVKKICNPSFLREYRPIFFLAQNTEPFMCIVFFSNQALLFTPTLPFFTQKPSINHQPPKPIEHTQKGLIAIKKKK